MKRLILSLTALALIGGTSVAQAQRGGDRGGRGNQGPVLNQIRLNINLGDREFTGQNNNLRLRQLINRQNPGLQLNRHDLVSVVLVAKSRAGNGRVALVVDGRSVDTANIPGRPADFNRNQGSTFSNVQLRAAGRSSDGNWVLNIDGNVKVRQLTVVLQPERNDGPRPPVPGPGTTLVKAAEGRFDKVIPDQNTHNVRLDDVQEIRVTAVDGPVLVRQLTLVFANGASQTYPINATVLRGQNVRVPVNGRDVRSIRIVGTSLDIIGSRATYRVDALVRGR